MNIRTVELEVIQYDTHAIGHATSGLIHNIAEYSGIGGTKDWPRLWYEVMTLIRDQTSFNCLWEANGMDVNLSFFLEPRPRIIKGELLYSSPEPFISFIERPEFVRPAVRTHIGRVTDEIAQEMQDVYHLRVERNPLVLVFPNQEYARKINRFRVPLIAA